MSTKKSTKSVVNKSTSPKKVLDNLDTSVTTEPSNVNKKKAGQPSKELKYSAERQVVYDKLWTILGISNEKMEFDLTALEKDKTRQQQIMDLEHDVKKYFTSGSWPYFAKPEIKDKYISLTRSILKQQKYTIQYFRAYDGKTNLVVQKTIKVIKIDNK